VGAEAEALVAEAVVEVEAAVEAEAEAADRTGT
jgi:hypothetical protein